MRRLSEVEPGTDNNFNLLRLVAASGVLVSHAYPIALGPEAQQPLERMLGMTLGHLCVLIFFCVSGFFITRSFDRCRSLPRFLEARALRLFPALAAMLVATVVVCGLWLTRAPAASFWEAAPPYVLRNISLFSPEYELPGVFGDAAYGPAINGSLWTLFYEVLCYLGVALLGVTGLLAPGRRGRICGVAIVLGCAAAVVLAGLRPGLLPVRLERLADLGLPFAIGGLFYLARQSVVLHLGVAALGLAASLAMLAGPWGTPLFAPVFAAALCYAVLTLGYAPIPLLRAYTRVGDYSYGIYIFAFPLQQLGAELGYRLPLANMLFAAPVTLICAILSWHLIEKPALSLKQGRPALPPSPGHAARAEASRE